MNMTDTQSLVRQIEAGGFDETFSWLYPGASPQSCRGRYTNALASFEALFGVQEAVLVSAPGRTEVCGNHTDHQRGRVLAAAVNLDILCVAAPNADNVIRIQSEGFPLDQISLNDLSAQDGEREKAASLIRGIAAWFQSRGYPIGGFNAYTTSNVLKGSGLSSSAAFEVAVGNILKALYGGAPSPQELAIAGQYAENQYFGKPSGLMDQMASSVGGFVQIDFADPAAPDIQPLSFNLADHGYHLCIVDTGGSHADLTSDYAAIPAEMRQIAAHFCKEYLREVDEDQFRASLPELRALAGDRAVLRAMHFFGDNALVPQMAQALRRGDLSSFLEMEIRSGRSSFCRLQNVFSTKNASEQGLSLALAVSEAILEGRGSWRVHGGGFAGTIQAFVPSSLLDSYRTEMDALFGAGACHILSVRPVGGTTVTSELKKEALAHG